MNISVNTFNIHNKHTLIRVVLRSRSRRRPYARDIFVGVRMLYDMNLKRSRITRVRRWRVGGVFLKVPCRRVAVCRTR